ncbi:hypothetical protein AVEN_181191-1 [Araneus ventricosus]|uniref:Tc1-like transposase DDE domain-containing protein n=1 Tax=Araneus ventricosus TaxID=182803 RepID=A0A4Y2TKW0_ARAVE|nr:hypothetical protein AVEN_181191-1 [Araneus ventricosus]
MARGLATDLAVRNQIIQQHQNGISQHQIGRTFFTQSTVCSIIKLFTTTGKNRPGKAPSLKLTLIDREVSLFRRHIHIFVKIGTWQLQTYSHGQDKVLERLFPKHLRLDISKGVATNSTKPGVSHFSLHRINVGVLRGPNLTSDGLHLSGNVLWTHESIFEVLCGKIGRKVIRKKDEANDPSCYKRVVFEASFVMVWGCLAANGVDNLHFCTGTIKAPDYIRVRDVNLGSSVQRLFDRKRYLFQQDDARPHTAQITKTWLRTKFVSVLEWSAASPDLSPIENIWRMQQLKFIRIKPLFFMHYIMYS